MEVLVLSHRDVRELLPMAECIDVMEDTLTTVGRGQALNPLRTAMKFPGGYGLLGMMPSYLGVPESAGIKVVTVMPGNHGTEFDSHQGVVVLFEMKHGRPLAIMDASSITAIRTAAVSAVATKLLAREDARKLAILGSGVQAGVHLEAMRLARDITQVVVWSRSPERARTFAERQSEPGDLAIDVADAPQKAVTGADVVCTTTSATEPVLAGAWLSPGTHINAIGACLPHCRELDTEAVRRSRFFVDRRESAFKEAGEFIIAKSEGAIDERHIAGEVGEILLGYVNGRESKGEITVFKSLGIGAEDLGAANHIYQKALLTGAGTSVELGGHRQ